MKENKYKGITYDKTNKKSPWRARIYQGSKVIYVGRFQTKEAAFEAKQKYIQAMAIEGPHLTEKSIPW